MKISKMILAASILTSTMAVADVERKITKTFDVNANSEFRLDNVNGEVDISTWDKATIEVIANISADSEKALNLIEVEMRSNSNGVTVHTHHKKNNWGNGGSGSVDYIVKVPKSVSLKSIEMVNGSLQVEGVEGEVDVEMVNGSVSIEGLTRDSHVSSVNGSIDISYASAASDLDEIELETVNGRIKLTVPESMGLDVDVETMHGSIKNDMGLQMKKSGFIGKELTGIVGNGEVNVEIETVNGGVRIKTK